MADYDSPWKDAVDHLLPSLLALLFPEVDEEVDWTLGYDSLEQELRKLAPEGETGKRLADKLVRVRSRSGDDRYLHLEVQSQPQTHFERRVFVYHYRGDDRFGLPTEMLVVLADDDPAWRPTTYVVGLKYTRLVFEFKPVKLLDWASRQEDLLSHPNLFGLFVLAHLESRRTRGDQEERARVKLGLIRHLLDRKLDAEEMRQWYKYLDWFLDLPAEYEAALWQEIKRLEQENQMPFTTFAERYGREQGEREGKREGKREGLLQGLEAVLEVKFGAQGLELLPALRQVQEPSLLETILQTARQATNLDAVRQVLPPTTKA